MVSKFEGISIPQVWDLGVVNFLNDILYLKFKAEHESDLINKATKSANR